MRFLTAVLILCATLAAQDFSRLHVEKVAGDFKFTEGPVWSHDGYLLFSDIPANTIHRYTPGKTVDVFRSSSEGANGNAFDAQGRLYTCEGRSRRVTRTARNGSIEVLAERFEGKRFNSPNDIVVRRDGNVYFTDPAFGESERARELDFFGVFHITPKGDIEVIAKPQGRPNGVALSPDGRVLYVANSDEKNVRAYDLDRQGRASNERVVVSGIAGTPDGMRVDAKGNLYVTAKAVYVFTPEGKQLAEIPIAEIPANCAFGDADLQTLYVTARTSLYRVRVPVKGFLPY